MKQYKILISLLIILVIAIIGSNVFADMSAPIVNPYEAYISNVQGADYYKESRTEASNFVGKLTYGEKIKITYEYSTNGVRYGNFRMNGENYYIKLSDITPINDKTVDTSVVNFSNEMDIKIFADNGVEIYYGPSDAYSKTGIIIPKGVMAKAYELVDNTWSSWYYVTYNGTNGFISILDGAVGKKASGKLLTPVPTYIYDKMYVYDAQNGENDDRNAIVIIPANSFITDYWRLDQWSSQTYVTYNGASGYINDYDFIGHEFATKSASIRYTGAKMYNIASMSGEVLVENIPYGTNLNYNYAVGKEVSWIYTTYNGKTGWVIDAYSDSEYEDIKGYELMYRTYDDMKISSSNSGKSVTSNPTPIVTAPTVNSTTSNISDDGDNILPNEALSQNANQGLINSNMVPVIVLVCVVVAAISIAIAIIALIVVNVKKKQ